jgi:hypothetical protein
VGVWAKPPITEVCMAARSPQKLSDLAVLSTEYVAYFGEIIAIKMQILYIYTAIKSGYEISIPRLRNLGPTISMVNVNHLLSFSVSRIVE